MGPRYYGSYFMVRICEYRQGSMEIAAWFAFSIFNAAAPVHRLGLTNAANIVLLVGPWSHPAEEMPASIGAISALQSAVDKAAG